MSRRLNIPVIFILLFAAMLLASCRGSTNLPASLTPTSATEAATITPTTETTPTSAPPIGQILLVAPEHASQRSEVADTLETTAAENGWGFIDQTTELSSVESSTQVVVWMEPQTEVQPVVAGAPETRFIVITGQAIEGQGNLTVLRYDRKQMAFLGGYITQMISPDFRGGALMPAEQNELTDAFQNGGHYWCGRCVPVYAPIVFFPMTGTANSNADTAAWQSAFDGLNQNRVETVFFSSEAMQPDVLRVVARPGLTLLGEGHPGDEFTSSWAVTLAYDLQAPLAEALSAAVSGNEGTTIRIPLALQSMDEEIISPGKLTLIEQVIDDLAGGWIEPLSVPLE